MLLPPFIPAGQYYPSSSIARYPIPMPVFFWSLVSILFTCKAYHKGLWAESRGRRPPFCPLCSVLSLLLLTVINPNRLDPSRFIFQWSRGEFLPVDCLGYIGFNSALRALCQRDESLCSRWSLFVFWWRLYIFWIVFFLNATYKPWVGWTVYEVLGLCHTVCREGRGPSAPFLSSLCSYTVGEVAEDRNLALSGHQYLLQLQSSEISNTWLLVLGGRQSDLCCVWVSF